MDTARLSAKGQITIPVAIRRRLGLQTGENVVFMEKFGNVFITSENEKPSATLSGNKLLPKERRLAILRSLLGSIDDPTFVEPAEVEYESPKDWELMGQ